VNEIDDGVLVAAGPDAGYENKLRELIKARDVSDKVRFTGNVGGGKLSAYVDADVRVYPWIYEVFGLIPSKQLCVANRS
jgi:glycosyltransferase involved in cell wall biosynthesis